ncbi:unnamed protein product [Cyprideis torosa]|uniref:Prenyltransferase alpha-alpha toroid domain-containing protein n=1 Tax=Cyprideis torosa TaxID=163714 RepID=A0A7R8WGS1_9CRUS|nr:unnamed protein product [Cyprideis torosa]CAG0893305.1 unnamed protein product [Cyprideis torosa]
MEDFGSLRRLLRTSAWVHRFITNLKKQRKKESLISGSLSVEELEAVQMKWIEHVQMKSYPDGVREASLRKLDPKEILNHDLSSELAGDMVHFLSRCQHPMGGFGGGPWQMAHLATTYAAINAVTTIGTQEAFDMILNHDLSTELAEDMVHFLSRCQHPMGGFGGGPWQMAHLATTYAAINAVTTIGTQEAFDMVDRESMVDFLWRMRQSDGTFLMHEGGESDVRGCYSPH